jgi:hypothetical protein
MTTVVEIERPGSKVPKRTRPRVRGRGWPVALAGIGAVIVLALAGYLWASSTSESAPRQVLVAAVAMEAGHVIAPADLSEAAVDAVDAESLNLISSDRAGSVVGQTLALPVAAGTPLSPNLLGPAASPAPGRALTSLALPEGSYPAGLEAGQSVVLVAGSGGEPPATAPEEVRQMAAVVRSVEAFEGGALIALEFNAADRAGLSAIRGTEPFLVAMVAEAPTAEAGE